MEQRAHVFSTVDELIGVLEEANLVPRREVLESSVVAVAAHADRGR
jgi:hypothetical protein